MDVVNDVAFTREVVKAERTGYHSHIRGIGVGDQMELIDQGIIGQSKARIAAKIIIELVRKGKIEGRAVLIAGRPCTGKTALAMGMAKSLGSNVLFTVITGSEVYSRSFSKIESLTQAVRKSIGIKIKDQREIITGEVVEIVIDRSIMGSEGRKGKITMKTTQMEAVYDLGRKMIDVIQKERVRAGDIITVDKNAGTIIRLGRSLHRSREYDATSPDVKFIRCPDGELQTRKEETHVVALHDIDVVNSRQHGFLALFSGDTGEIKSEIRDQINQKVAKWIEEEKAELVPGVLFVDEGHTLDIDCFSYLNKVLESPHSPVIIIATNKESATIKGTSTDGAHGIPADFIDRMLIIGTCPYTKDEMRKIVSVRAEEECISLNPESIDLLVDVAMEISLRYAIMLLLPSHFVAKRYGAEKVAPEHVQYAKRLFLDRQRSVAANRENLLRI